MLKINKKQGIQKNYHTNKLLFYKKNTKVLLKPTRLETENLGNIFLNKKFKIIKTNENSYYKKSKELIKLR